MILVDRLGGRQALRQMIEQAKRATAEGRKVLIFPQGTARRSTRSRNISGAGAAARSIPVSTFRCCRPRIIPDCSGKKSLVMDSGTVTMSYLAPIPPGLDRGEFPGAGGAAGLSTRPSGCSRQATRAARETRPAHSHLCQRRGQMPGTIRGLGDGRGDTGSDDRPGVHEYKDRKAGDCHQCTIAAPLRRAAKAARVQRRDQRQYGDGSCSDRRRRCRDDRRRKGRWSREAR